MATGYYAKRPDGSYVYVSPQKKVKHIKGYSGSGGSGSAPPPAPQVVKPTPTPSPTSTPSKPQKSNFLDLISGRQAGTRRIYRTAEPSGEVQQITVSKGVYDKYPRMERASSGVQAVTRSQQRYITKPTAEYFRSKGITVKSMSTAGEKSMQKSAEFRESSPLKSAGYYIKGATLKTVSGGAKTLYRESGKATFIAMGAFAFPAITSLGGSLATKAGLSATTIAKVGVVSKVTIGGLYGVSAGTRIYQAEGERYETFGGILATEVAPAYVGYTAGKAFWNPKTYLKPSDISKTETRFTKTPVKSGKVTGREGLVVRSEQPVKLVTKNWFFGKERIIDTGKFTIYEKYGIYSATKGAVTRVKPSGMSRWELDLSKQKFAGEFTYKTKIQKLYALEGGEKLVQRFKTVGKYGKTWKISDTSVEINTKVTGFKSKGYIQDYDIKKGFIDGKAYRAIKSVYTGKTITDKGVSGQLGKIYTLEEVKAPVKVEDMGSILGRLKYGVLARTESIITPKIETISTPSSSSLRGIPLSTSLLSGITFPTSSQFFIPPSTTTQTRTSNLQVESYTQELAKTITPTPQPAPPVPSTIQRITTSTTTSTSTTPIVVPVIVPVTTREEITTQGIDTPPPPPSITTFPIDIPFIPFVPPIVPPFSFFPPRIKGYGKMPSGKRDLRYQPSFLAVSQKIFGDKPNLITGLEVRPIPKDYDIFGFREKKKRKKRKRR